MPEFRLTAAAEEDLTGIALYGDEQFGERSIEPLPRPDEPTFCAPGAKSPALPGGGTYPRGLPAQRVRGSGVYDRIRPMDVLIVRILGRQDVESALPEGKMRPWTQTHICSFVGAEVREPHP